MADIETIVTELALADMAAVEKAIHRENKKARAGDTRKPRSSSPCSKAAASPQRGRRRARSSSPTTRS